MAADHPTPAPHPVRTLADTHGHPDTSDAAPADAGVVDAGGARVLRSIPFSDVSNAMLADLCEHEAETVHDLAMRLSVSADANNWIDPESDEARASNAEWLLRFAADRLRAPAQAGAGAGGITVGEQAETAKKCNPADAGEVDLLALKGRHPWALRDALVSAMQSAWNDFCADTGCYPDCIQRESRGRISADFDRSNFALFVAGWLLPVLQADRLRARAAETAGAG